MAGTPPVKSLNEDISPTVIAEFQQTMSIFFGLLSWALARLRIPDALGETPQTAAELAARTNLNPDALHRVMFMLAAKGIFAFENGRFRHTPMSLLLRSDHPQAPGRLRFVTPVLREPFAMIEHSLRTGRPGTELLGPGALFGHLARNPDEAETFDEFMTARSKQEVAAVVRAYDFSAFATIADIGGGRGHLIRSVLERTPAAQGVLFDLPRTIAPQLESGAPRLRLVAGDFFNDSLPTADCHILMNIIHDWDDEQSLAILRNLRKSASAGTRLLLIGMLMPREPVMHTVLQHDITMLLVAGGRERNAAEYETLLNAAGFRLLRIVPTQSEVSILEAAAA